MTDYYADLGLPRDASQADIKAAFRRAASKHHPDKGGNEALMKRANDAYETLGDPARRAEYDATGRDDGAERFEREARDRLLGVFDAVLVADGDLIAHARQLLATLDGKMREEHEMHARRAARLRKQRDRVIRKGGGENLFTGLVDTQLEGIDAQLAQLEHGRKVFARVRELLDEYEEAPGAVVASTNFAATGGVGYMIGLFGGQP
jgi:curved DNA-binding protein CbpA